MLKLNKRWESHSDSLFENNVVPYGTALVYITCSMYAFYNFFKYSMKNRFFFYMFYERVNRVIPARARLFTII